MELPSYHVKFNFLRVSVFAVRILLSKQSEFVAHMEHNNWVGEIRINEIYLYLKLSHEQQKLEYVQKQYIYILNCIAEMLNVYNLMSIVGYK